MRRLLLAASLMLAAFPAVAQDRAATLADLRSELSQLSGDLQSLRSELVASGSMGYAAAGGVSAIDRMNAMESRLMQLTGQTEQLQNRIDRIVKDGTTRIGDIEFRLCEMEEGCDLGALTTPTLGETNNGGGGSALPPSDQQGSLGTGASPAAPRTNTPSAGAATAAERADFDRAREVLGQGDFRRAADLFAAVAQTHAGGPLTAEALFLKGAALDSAGDLPAAGIAWLESFAAAPDGPQAPDALLGLSRAMSAAGEPRDGCFYLQEIMIRFAAAPQAVEAEKRAVASGCEDVTDSAEVEGMDPEAAADLQYVE